MWTDIKSNTILLPTLVCICFSSNPTNGDTETNNQYHAGISSLYNKTVCLQSVYGANITTVSLSWTLVRFQWFYEMVRKFNPTLDLTRNYAVEGDNGDDDSNSTLTLNLKLDPELFQIRLSLNVENTTSMEVSEQYECEFKISTRHGTNTQTALGRRQKSGNAVLFQWSFFNKRRKRLGELMEIYTRVVLLDSNGYYKIRESDTVILPLPNSMDQSINFNFRIKKIEFSIDDQVSFSR